MLVFGIDIPLVEVIFVLCIVIFLLLIEAIVVISLLMKQMHKTNKLGDLIQKLSQTLLEIKSAEIQELDKLRRK
jgi:predicted PurR-regulated permease PerM